MSYYDKFNENLVLIKSLRNPDLRERHWATIKELTNMHDIQDEKTTLNMIL